MKNFSSIRSIFIALCVLVFAFSATETNFAQALTRSLQTSSTNMTTTYNSSMVTAGSAFGIQANITVNTPSPTTFTCAVTDICTSISPAAHNFATGLKVQVSNSGGALPTGFAAATDYYVIKLTSNTFSLATSLALAQAGTAIDVSGIGSGTQTATSTALAGGAIKLQGSMDCVNFVDIAASSTAVTTTGNLIWTYSASQYQCVRASTTMTAGMLKADVIYYQRQ